MGNDNSVVSDVVNDTDEFRVSIKTQAKMQARHNIMLNIQNISKIVQDTENAINRYATILSGMELDEEKRPYQRIVADYIVPVVDRAESMGEIDEFLQGLRAQMDKHINQVVSMQGQHDGLSAEIDALIVAEKGEYEAGKQAKTKRRAGKRRG